MKKYKQVTIILFALLFIFTMTACTGKPSDDGSNVKTIRISMSILYPQSSEKKDTRHISMQVQEKATVMQVLESYTNQEGIPIVVDSYDTPAVTAINGVKAKNRLKWIYTINGKETSVSASECVLKNNDKIVWKLMKK